MERVATPLTELSDDERLFRDSVYEFADREIRPRVREMDESAHLPRELIDRLFELGVMGIEVPEKKEESKSKKKAPKKEAATA